MEKNKYSQKKSLMLLVVGALLIAGCSTIDCPLNNRVYSKYKLAGDVKTLNSKMTITANLHNGNDSVIINQAEKTDIISLISTELMNCFAWNFDKITSFYIVDFIAQ